MKIIEPNVQEVKDFEGVDNFYKAVARAARICYASDYHEQKQNEYYRNEGTPQSLIDSTQEKRDRDLVERLIKSGHFSPFEHAIITIPCHILNNISYRNHCILSKLKNKYTILTEVNDNDRCLASINGRILIEAIVSSVERKKVLDFIQPMLILLKENERTNCNLFKSFIVDTSIGCTRQLNTHHDNCYHVEQSTRYCNFSKDKFGNEVSFNKPYWYDNANAEKQQRWKEDMEQAECNYFKSLKNGDSLDEARGRLPLDTHTRAIYTATIEEWQHIIDLRLKGTTGKPHEDLQIIAEKINDLLIAQNTTNGNIQ